MVIFKKADVGELWTFDFKMFITYKEREDHWK